MPDRAEDRPLAPWLGPGAFLPLPPAAPPWGLARVQDRRLVLEPVPDAAELARRACAKPDELVLFAWGPGDRHLRTVYEIEAIAPAVEAHGEASTRADLRKSGPPLLATLALLALGVVYWPSDPGQQFLLILAALFIVAPLWQRGVEGAWIAWSGLRLLRRDPAAWRDAQARQLRFAAWPARGESWLAVALVAAFAVTWLGMHWVGTRLAVERLGLVKEKTRAGEWWRLVSCGFLHGGLVHILFNSIVALSLARVAKRLLDASYLLFTFLLSVVAGSLASVLLAPHGLPSIGASGGILGWGGLLFGLALRHPGLRGCGLGASIGRWVVLLALIGAAGAGFIDNAAHAGGFLAGLAVGLWAARDRTRPLPLPPLLPRPAWFALLAACAAAWLGLLYVLVRDKL